MARADRILALIPAAGESRRWVEAGYTDPKWALRVGLPGIGEGTMLSLILAGLPQHWEVRVGTTTQNMPALARIVGEERAVDVGPPTGGQAETVELMLMRLRPARASVIVLNADIVWGPGAPIAEMETGLDEAEVTIMCHRSRDPNCSYVDRFHNPTMFAEKRPISEWAMSGAWGFHSANALVHSIMTARGYRRLVGGELYLSSALDYYHGRRKVLEVSAADHIDLGTPELAAHHHAEILSV